MATRSHTETRLRASIAASASPTTTSGSSASCSGVMTEIDASTQFLRLPSQPPADTRTLSLASAGHAAMTACLEQETQLNARLFEVDTTYHSSGREIPRSHWSFGKPSNNTTNNSNSNTPFEVDIDGSNVTLFEEGGFAKGKVYRLIYDTLDAVPTGVGLAAIRDAAMWLRTTSHKSKIHIYAVGGSQTGRLLRTFIHDGFNNKECSNNVSSVFDGFSIWVAGASRGQFNQLGGQPSQALPHLSPVQFPFSPASQQEGDKSSKPQSLHDRLDSSGRVKVLYINTSIEYHRGDASLLHTSLDGSTDLLLNDNVRVYMLSGAPHNPIPAWPPSYADGIPISMGVRVQQSLTNPIQVSPFFRSTLLSLHNWISNDVSPPLSVYPTLKENQLVRPHLAYDRFKTLSSKSEGGVFAAPLSPPDHPSQLWRRDYGYSLSTGVCSSLPPIDGLVYEGALVPEVDSDGNDLGGVKLPVVAVPLGAHTGWALRSRDFGGETFLMMIGGGFHPYTKEKIQTLYPNGKEDYLLKVRSYAEELVTQRWLLEEDVKNCVAEAEKLWNWVKDN